MTRSTTYEAVEKWKSDLDSKVFLPNGSPIPAVLLANKVVTTNYLQKKEMCLMHSNIPVLHGDPTFQSNVV